MKISVTVIFFFYLLIKCKIQNDKSCSTFEGILYNILFISEGLVASVMQQSPLTKAHDIKTL